MKIRYLSSAAAVLALALTQISGAGTLTLNNTNQGTIGTVSINSSGDMVVTTGAPPPPPTPGTPVCTLSASAINIQPTQNSTLTATCTNSPISWSWTASSGAPAAPTGASGSVSSLIDGSFTYSVLATNTTGPGNPSNSVTINVATPQQLPGNCPALPTGTRLTNYNVAWSPKGVNRKQLYPIKNNEIAALKFTADGPLSSRLGYIAWVPNTTVASKSVIVNISRCPGDFTQPSSPATYLCRGEGGTGNVGYTQAGAYSAFSYQCIVGTGDYYINIRNGIRASGSNKDPSYTIADTCPTGGTTCGVTIEFN